MSERLNKVSSVVHREVAAFLENMELPAMVTVSKAEISPDLKYGKVFITILPDDEKTQGKTLELIKGGMYDLQGHLNRKLEMKIVPRIRFEIDHSESYASKIDSILKNIDEKI
jgi:ribosome-binding factor A